MILTHRIFLPLHIRLPTNVAGNNQQTYLLKNIEVRSLDSVITDRRDQALGGRKCDEGGWCMKPVFNCVTIETEIWSVGIKISGNNARMQEMQ
ncbi:hypothetical protein A3196_13815 [Candidatus Thiodiazotropha endoloripes]|uniref:Uncharacterized protein n=1 Tax=Candidatus Thiodiazotropha endoloripes TaxID=1818881 RepID=A0A1E2UT30_9GAMM|nr:hypothetical protein A3196_13815 [Candidatus Thiodiazotropha endoloripes]